MTHDPSVARDAGGERDRPRGPGLAGILASAAAHAGGIERTGLLILVLGLLVGFLGARPVPSRVVLLDVSASVIGRRGGSLALPACWRTALGALPAVVFAEGTASFRSLTAALAAVASGTISLHGNRTRLLPALRLVREIHPEASEVVLIGDGEWLEDREDLATALGGIDTVIHTVAFAGPPPPDARVAALGGPGWVHPGEPFSLAFRLEATGKRGPRRVGWAVTRRQEGTERGREDGIREKIAAGVWEVSPEKSWERIHLEDRLPEKGWWTYEVEVTAGGGEDEVAEDDQAVLAVSCGGVLRVGRIVRGSPIDLPVVPGAPRVERRVSGVLREGSLDGYGAVTLENLSGADLNQTEVGVLRAFVRRGGTVVFFGGERSFALGASAGTALDDWLPLHAVPPQATHLDVLLLLDRSGSMAGGGAMARARAMLQDALGRFAVGDRVRLLPFAGIAGPPITLKREGSREADPGGLRELGLLEAHGGTRLAPALAEAQRRLEGGPEWMGRILIASDGVLDERDLAAAAGRVRDLRRMGVTVWCASGESAPGAKALAALAREGGGRRVNLEDPSALGLALSRASHPDALREGLLAVHAPRGSVFENLALPPVRRILVTRLSRGSQTLLDAAEGLPLAASRIEGRGRVLAWAGLPTTSWMPGWGELGARPWAWIFRAEEPVAHEQARIDARPGGLRVTLETSPDATAEAVRTPRVRLLPEGTWRALEPVGPGIWSLAIDVPGDRHELVLDGLGSGTGMRVMDPPRLPDPEWLGQGVDRERLERMAARTGGVFAQTPRDLPPPRFHARESRIPATGIFFLAFLLLALGWASGGSPPDPPSLLRGVLKGPSGLSR